MADFEKDLKKIIEIHFKNIKENRNYDFPEVLKKPFQWLTAFPPSYFILLFGQNVDMDRIAGLMKKGFHPFPGLISENPNLPVMFKVNGRNTYFQDCSVKGGFSFLLGKDSTVILQNHIQNIKTKELGEYEYCLPLAYILSFGDLIKKENMIDYIGELITFSVQKWRLNESD